MFTHRSYEQYVSASWQKSEQSSCAKALADTVNRLRTTR